MFTVLPQVTQQFITSDVSKLPPRLRESSTRNDHSTRSLQELAWVIYLYSLRDMIHLIGRDDEVVGQLQAVEEKLQLTIATLALLPSHKLLARGSLFDEYGHIETKDDYLSIVLGDILPFSSCIEGKDSASSNKAHQGGSSSIKDGGDHQSSRDIERDVLVVNGVLYKPGTGGSARVLTWLKDIMLALVREYAPPSQRMMLEEEEKEQAGSRAKSQLERFAKEILREANRTNSGGVAYDLCMNKLGYEGVVMLVPDSKAAEPLMIDIDVGAFVQGEGEQATYSYGLRAKIRASTYYDILDESLEDRYVRVRGEYRNVMCLPFLGGALEAHASLWIKAGAYVHVTKVD